MCPEHCTQPRGFEVLLMEAFNGSSLTALSPTKRAEGAQEFGNLLRDLLEVTEKSPLNLKSPGQAKIKRQ